MILPIMYFGLILVKGQSKCKSTKNIRYCNILRKIFGDSHFLYNFESRESSLSTFIQIITVKNYNENGKI